MKRSELNYYVDAAIGLAFLVSAISGAVFLVPLSWLNYEPGQAPTVLGLAYATWRTLHTVSSLAMVLGAALHVALHARWIQCMTQRVFRRAGSECPTQPTTVRNMRTKSI